ncbi:hypothetical protein ABPG74_006898 [Tetrahymena malaccensis]
MENKSQSKIEIENKENVAQYTLLSNINNIEEGEQLLKLVNNHNQCQDSISNISSQCDQSIQLIASNLLDSKVKNQENQQQDYQEPLKSANKYNSSEIVDTVKEYVNSFLDLFKWKREYDSFNQLYFQIGFDSLLALYFYKKQKKLNSQRDKSKQDEQIANQMTQRLKNYGFYLYHASKIGENTLIYTEKQVEQKILENQRNKIINLYTQDGYLTVEVDQKFKYQDKALPIKTANEMGLLTKITASTLSFLSGKLFKSKISFNSTDNDGKLGIFLFGKKAILNNKKIGLHIKQQFQELDLRQYKFDQIAYSISILVATGLCLYFSTKLVKNVIYLAKKKKLFRKKK